jgi:hypothetical protein
MDVARAVPAFGHAALGHGLDKTCRVTDVLGQMPPLRILLF